MTTQPPDAPDHEFGAHELLRMDEAEARQTLTVAQFERWESIQDIHDDADERQAEWDAQAETVADITVNADMEQLGTRVEIYGNDLLVHADPEAPKFREAVDRLEGEFGDIEGSDVAEDELDPDRAGEYAEHMLTLLDAVLVKWGDTRWEDIPTDEREATLGEVRSKWGVAGLMQAWGDIAVAIREDHEEVVGDLEKFRDPERRGRR